MGNCSNLVFANEAANSAVIDWERVPVKAKEYLENQYGLDDTVKTIGDLGKVFDGYKFITYFTEELLQSLLDISYHGFPSPVASGEPISMPRLYYTLEGFDQINCIQLVVGTRIAILAEHNMKGVFNVCGDVEEDDYQEKYDKHVLQLVDALEEELKTSSVYDPVAESAVPVFAKPSSTTSCPEGALTESSTAPEVPGSLWKCTHFDDCIKAARRANNIMNLGFKNPICQKYMKEVFASFMS